jgi:hypothetical protein
VNTTVSAARLAVPVSVREAPPVADELLHPRPGPEGGFPHGQGITPPEPGSQKVVPGDTGQVQRTTTTAGKPAESKVTGGFALFWTFE